MAKILVVEDDESVCALLETNLLIKGHDVSIAKSGSECLELLDKETPALIVLDIMLPDTDGFELLEHIRGTPETEHTPVLVLTARGDERDRVRGFANGADDYLVKPFYSTELLLRIDRLLTKAATGSSLRKLALTDPVTGLGNRSYFSTRLEQLLGESDRENVDLTLFVIDLPGLPDQIRKVGWKTTDMVLARFGSAIKSNLRSKEEAFWIGTQCVVTSLEIESGAAARARLDEMKKEVKACLDGFRRQVSLIPYFGYCFYEPPETPADILDKVTAAPYGKTPAESPRQKAGAGKAASSIETAFGGKLTGLAPVDYAPDSATRAKRTSGEQKIDPRLASLLMREMTASKESRDPIAKRSTQPIPVEAPKPASLPKLDESLVVSALEEMCESAKSEQHDLAVCCLSFEGTEEAKERLDASGVDAVLTEAATQAAMRAGLDEFPGAQAFWTGRYFFVAIPGASVPDARKLALSLGETASTNLAPHRLNLKVTPAAGYTFFDFEESPSALLDKAKDSPHKGGVLVTPLQALRRSGPQSESSSS